MDKSKETQIYFDLILDNYEEVRVSCDDNLMDDVVEAIELAVKTGGLLHSLDMCEIRLKNDRFIDTLVCRRVIGYCI